MNPHGDINPHQVLAEIVPGAVGPVACPGIDMFADPITQQGFQITVYMVITPRGEAADIAFKVEDKLGVSHRPSLSPKNGSTYWLL